MIPIADFCERNGYSIASIYTAVHQKTFLSTFVHGKYVDEDAYIDMLNYKETVVDIAHTVYYPCVELFGNEHKLSMFLSKITEHSHGTWIMFFSKNLFMRSELKKEPSKMHVEFAIYGAAIFFLAIKNDQLKKEDWL